MPVGLWVEGRHGLAVTNEPNIAGFKHRQNSTQHRVDTVLELDSVLAGNDSDLVDVTHDFVANGRGYTFVVEGPDASGKGGVRTCRHENCGRAEYHVDVPRRPSHDVTRGIDQPARDGPCSRFGAHHEGPLDLHSCLSAHGAQHRHRAARPVNRRVIGAAIEVEKRIAIRPAILGREPGLVTTPQDKTEPLLRLMNIGDGRDVQDAPPTLRIYKG